MSGRYRLTVLTLNLFNDRADASKFERAIVRHRPDVVAVQELGPEAARVLERHYEHGLLRPQTDYNGMGLALTFAADAEEIETPEPRAITAVVPRDAAAASGLEPIRLMSVRLPPPFSKSFVSTRRQYAESLLRVADDHVGPLCLVGDLNATPIWPAYRMLTRALRDGATPSGRSLPLRGATWPSSLPIFRIDHVLLRGMSESRVKRVSVRGTDHRGLVAELVVDSDLWGKRERDS